MILSADLPIAFGQAGDPLPSAAVQEGSPDNKVTLKDVFGSKTGILFGVPGAYTPVCSKVRLCANQRWVYKHVRVRLKCEAQ